MAAAAPVPLPGPRSRSFPCLAPTSRSAPLAWTRRSPSSPFPTGAVLGAMVALAVVALGLWFVLRPSPEMVDDWAPSAFDREDVEAPAVDAVEFETFEPLDLPALSASDEAVRRLLATLSAHPEWARWLVTDDLIRRFVGVVVDLAGSFHPAEHVPFLRPEAAFTVSAEGSRTVMSEASMRRYDLHVAVLQSLDVEGSIRLYRQLRPLIDEAYADLGVPGDFDDALTLAFRNVREVRLPPEPWTLVQDEGVWLFSDPEIEGLRGAAKGLLRMGPDNARRVQERLGLFERRLLP